MFGKILGKREDEVSDEDKKHLETVEKVSKMNLTDMRIYIKDGMKGFKSSENGLISIMNKLLTRDEKTQKRYIEIDDMDSKMKKGFELVLSIASHKRVSLTSVEQIQEFMTLYKDVILKFDTDNKQIYSSKLKNSLEKSLQTIQTMAEVNNKAKLLGE